MNARQLLDNIAGAKSLTIQARQTQAVSRGAFDGELAAEVAALRATFTREENQRRSDTSFHSSAARRVQGRLTNASLEAVSAAVAAHEQAAKDYANAKAAARRYQQPALLTERESVGLTSTEQLMLTEFRTVSHLLRLEGAARRVAQARRPSDLFGMLQRAERAQDHALVSAAEEELAFRLAAGPTDPGDTETYRTLKRELEEHRDNRVSAADRQTFQVIEGELMQVERELRLATGIRDAMRHTGSLQVFDDPVTA